MKYERVVELLLELGTVVRTHDRSEQVAEVRRQITAGERPDPDATADMSAWIARTFELDYGRSAL